MAEIKHLEKGDILISEGDQSASLYWLQKGSLRLYKKNDSGFIELGFLKEGELVGEMSFLDNEPRSASVEALQSCDLIEIQRGKFNEVMKNQPTWMNTLIQTLVRRLRTTNNRLREIEGASNFYPSGPSSGTASKSHTTNSGKNFSVDEIISLTTAILLAGARRGERMPNNQGIIVNSSWLHLYGGGFLSIPVTKVTSYMEILQEAGVVNLKTEGDITKVIIVSIDFLEHFAKWLHSENIKNPGEKINLSGKATILCDLIYQYGELNKFGAQEIIPFDYKAFLEKASAQLNTKLPIDATSAEELIRNGLGENDKLNLAKFKEIYPCLNLRQRFLDHR